jgi:hypothetical protein
LKALRSRFAWHDKEFASLVYWMASRAIETASKRCGSWIHTYSTGWTDKAWLILWRSGRDV